MSSARPEPVLSAAAIAGAVAGIVGVISVTLASLGATTGWSWAAPASAVVAAIGAMLAGVMPYITALGARAQVTPLAAPQAMDGTQLVRS